MDMQPLEEFALETIAEILTSSRFSDKEKMEAIARVVSARQVVLKSVNNFHRQMFLATAEA